MYCNTWYLHDPSWWWFSWERLLVRIVAFGKSVQVTSIRKPNSAAWREVHIPEFINSDTIFIRKNEEETDKMTELGKLSVSKLGFAFDHCITVIVCHSFVQLHLDITLVPCHYSIDNISSFIWIQDLFSSSFFNCFIVNKNAWFVWETYDELMIPGWD